MCVNDSQAQYLPLNSKMLQKVNNQQSKVNHARHIIFSNGKGVPVT